MAPIGDNIIPVVQGQSPGIAAGNVGHRRGYPTLLSLTGLPVGALVLADRAAAGDIWLPDGTRQSLARTIMAGGHPQVLTPVPQDRARNVSEPYDRQSLLFGASGQRVLGQARIGIIGAGGGRDAARPDARAARGGPSDRH